MILTKAHRKIEGLHIGLLRTSNGSFHAERYTKVVMQLRDGMLGLHEIKDIINYLGKEGE